MEKLKLKLKILRDSRKGYDSLSETEKAELQKAVVVFYNKSNTFESTWKHFCISNTFCRKLIMTSGNKTALKYMQSRQNRAYVYEFIEDVSREFSKLIINDNTISLDKY
jgi:hypothetical protein